MTPYYQDDWVTLYQGHVLDARRAIGIEAKADYCTLTLARLNQLALPLNLRAKEL